MLTMNTFAIIRALIGCDGTVDIGEMDSEAVRDLVRGIALGRSVLASLESRAVLRLNELQEAPVAEYALTWHGRSTSAEARAAVRRAEAISAMPLFGQALEDGDITPAHVDAVARGLKQLGEKSRLLVEHEQRLVSEAACLPVDKFSRLVANLVGSLDRVSENDRLDHQRRSAELKMWEDHRTGMVRMSGRFDPETGSRLWTILDASVEAMFHGGSGQVETAAGVEENDHRRARALCDLVEAGASALPACTTTVATEVVVTIDLDTLVNGVHACSVRRDANGIDLPVDVIRRMGCDAGIVPMVLNGDGVVVDVGKAKRLATRRQRRAIFAMHDTCAAPGCGVRVAHCVPHHIRWWEDGGTTDLDNLVPLCSRHHHAVHEGGWKLAMDAARRVTMTPPGG